MCGIIAGFNTQRKGQTTEKVNEFIINQYQDQYDRGQKGFGIIRIKDNQDIELDRACEPTKFLLDLYLKESKMIIAHHRTPTSTDNLMSQTHPMSISNSILEKDYLIVHNGIVSNCNELHQKHTELGFTYQTEYQQTWYDKSLSTKWNDSESLAIEIALFIEKKISAIGTDNTAAFIVLQLNKKTHKAEKVYFGRNGSASCLNMSKGKGKLRLSSEGEGEEIIDGKLFSFNVKDAKMTLKDRPMPFVKKEIPKLIEDKKETKVEDKKANEILNLPIQKEDNKTAPIWEKGEVRSLRSWYENQEDKMMADDVIFSEIAGKNYPETRATEFKELIKNHDARGTAELAEDALDEEMDKISEILSEYKTNIMVEKFKNREEFNYSTQIFKIVKAMREIADIADTEYLEKTINEEVDSYNGSYTGTSPKTVEDMEEDYHYGLGYGRA